MMLYTSFAISKTSVQNDDVSASIRYNYWPYRSTEQLPLSVSVTSLFDNDWLITPYQQ